MKANTARSIRKAIGEGARAHAAVRRPGARPSARQLLDAETEARIDDIKDEIDALADIDPKRRLGAARDLIEYIQLHYIDHPEG